MPSLSPETITALSNGGAGVLVLVAVLVLLYVVSRYQSLENRRRDEREELNRRDANEARHDFQAQLREIVGALREGQRESEAQLQRITENHMALTRETITVVRGLDATVQAHTQAIRHLEDSRLRHPDTAGLDPPRPAPDPPDRSP